MRKTIVKLLNLIYIAAAGVAIWGLCTKPIIKATANLHVSAKQIGDFIAPLINSSTESRDSHTISREGVPKEIKDYLTPEGIAEAFEPYDGLNIKDFTVEIPASTAFKIKNKNVIQEVVDYNINTLLDAALNGVVPPLQEFILNVTESYARDALKTAIDAQIAKFLGNDSALTDAQAQQIYDNIEEVLSRNEPVELQELTSVIIGDGTDDSTNALSILNSNPYRLCDPQPSEEDFLENPTKFFVKGEDGTYTNPESYSAEETYYISKTYTQEDIDRVDVESKMTDALSSVPGLVETDFEEATPTSSQFAETVKAHHYFIYNGSKYINAEVFNSETIYYGRKYILCEGDDLEKVKSYPNRYYFVAEDGSYAKTTVYDSSKTYYKTADVDGYESLETQPSEEQFNSDKRSTTYYTKSGDIYTLATTYSSETTYYVYKTTVNDIDTALTTLINQYLLGKDEDSSSSEEPASTRSQTRADILNLSKSQEGLKEALKEFALGKIPYETIININNQFGSYVPLVLLAVIAIFALPWAWFAFITIIRTMRRKKVWTRPRIIIFLAFPQLFLGFILTYGVKYAIPFLANKVAIIQQINGFVQFDLSTLCFVPSIVYLGVLVFSIVYAIIAHPVKYEYKLEKKMLRREKKMRRKEI